MKIRLIENLACRNIKIHSYRRNTEKMKSELSGIAGVKLNTGNKSLLGIDVGSTTAKLVLVRNGEIVYTKYERHFSQVRHKIREMILEIEPLLGNERLYIAVSGSAGLGLAGDTELPFVQEVFATSELVKQLEPDTSVVIELGGEDAKIIFLKGFLEQRMNGTCAGGTGAFIDQMATLMNMSIDELDKLSLQSTKIYPIASRCGVFAKSDIQPLLNQGANKADIAAGIFQAVVDQTIAGLAQGRKIEGKVMFLGGPLYYCKGLRKRFVETLKLDENNAVFPEYGRFSVALGAALFASKQQNGLSYSELVEKLEKCSGKRQTTSYLRPLFENEESYEEFRKRHGKATVERLDINEYTGDAYLGIDCGSTTTKLVLMSADKKLLYSYYGSNQGNPIDIIRRQLLKIYELCGNRITIKGSAVTGYGEELIKHAFHIDAGIVETMAHLTAARHFNPDVDFILDIGGQDIKCFKIRNGTIDSVMLNEACSSGCGSFIETFAKSMGYDVEEFSKLGLKSKAPVDLGTRCTVFMNSSVKQAQKDGADISDISAGLSMSVVRNALYKVIRAGSADELGKNIVVQGGTFLNDAVLRSFELEIGRNVIRPQIAGLMGAFGAALYAMSLKLDKSSVLDENELKNFTHRSVSTVCKGCGNKCHLTVNIFSEKEKYISGNKCERGLGGEYSKTEEVPDLHEFKRKRLESLSEGENIRGTIGMPLALGMYELAPFWHRIFTDLGFRVIFSGFSSRELYTKGQGSIPSDTVCYPAKLMHGHIETLIEKKPDYIFYPCLTYNFDEKTGDNHYNCPVVAYYSEVLNGNMESLKNTRFLYPYLNINSRRELAKELYSLLKPWHQDLTLKEVKRAVNSGFREYDRWMEELRSEGRRAIEYAKENNKRVLILAGRPYHVDPEIGHGIDKLAVSLGFVVITEDSISDVMKPENVGVLNQWTYHARLYNAAEYAGHHENCELVQLVSFGCGIDAITSDEVRAILEKHGKIYTQIKIDEIANPGAVKIRLRSLLGALEEREKQKWEKQKEKE
ncbi:CoA-substrate-specific enzyme activase [Thermoclostridium stercorarium subsp. stercorarium DSM 8532]|uniref:CoA-substrate-specific enzyme activase n=3 Tax=Thermoclostridium stercorarium TaxID=1510 RepID=L7VRG1_THES1|nr:CoA-substrate-specific enzyme activase [Thermoclostridium stercorarium subsp. stercorarium DSM 8532]